MAHPFAGQARSSSASKFKGMTGMKSGGAVHSDEAQDRKLFAKMIKDKRAEGGRVPGKAAGGRLDKAARGGVIKKNYGGPLMGPGGPGLMPGAIPPQAGIPPQATGALPPQAMAAMPPYKRGGAVKKAEGGEIKPLEPAKGSIERLGVNTYRRELGRDSATKKFGKSEYPKTYKKGGRVKGSKVNVNIVSLPKGEDRAAPLPAALPAPVGMAAAGALPPVAPGGGPPIRPPMARGGRTHTGGDNGVGRLEKAAVAKRRNG